MFLVATTVIRAKCHHDLCSLLDPLQALPAAVVVLHVLRELDAKDWRPNHSLEFPDPVETKTHIIHAQVLRELHAKGWHRYAPNWPGFGHWWHTK